MELKEIREKKQKLEKMVNSILVGILEDFEEETDLKVEEINITWEYVADIYQQGKGKEKERIKRGKYLAVKCTI